VEEPFTSVCPSVGNLTQKPRRKIAISINYDSCFCPLSIDASTRRGCGSRAAPVTGTAEVRPVSYVVTAGDGVAASGRVVLALQRSGAPIARTVEINLNRG